MSDPPFVVCQSPALARNMVAANNPILEGAFMDPAKTPHAKYLSKELQTLTEFASGPQTVGNVGTSWAALNKDQQRGVKLPPWWK